VTGLKPGVERQIESKLGQVEIQAAILISHEHVDSVDAQVGVLPVQANGRLIWSIARNGTAHCRNYRLSQIDLH
jgi:hypothetical protein